MIFSHRRVLTLGVLATLIIGSAVASDRVALLPPARVSSDVLLERAEPTRPDQPPPSLETGQLSTNPQTEGPAAARSEEHTSELQSRGHLVCRLLLEKKKKKIEE